jgi:hypothetical protein
MYADVKIVVSSGWKRSREISMKTDSTVNLQAETA